MIKIKWSIEEAVVLFSFYINGTTNKQDLKKLSDAYKRRAEILGIKIDAKFRNMNGLSMQLGCITYVVTGGKHGFSSASKLFYETYDLYKTKPELFASILQEFKDKYM